MPNCHRRPILGTALAALVVALALGLGACSAITGVANGSALEKPVGENMIGGSVFPPGTRLGYVFVYLTNHSHAPLTIDSVPIRGRGIGTVARIVEVEVAPPGRHAVGGGGFDTNPPVMQLGDVCHVQPLWALAGYRLRPGAHARLWVVLLMLRPGVYHVPVHVVYYTQNGVRYREVLTVGYYGIVRSRAHRIEPDQEEKPCLRMTKLLNP